LIYSRVTQRTFFENERLLALWQKLAAANGLTFVPGVYRLPGAKAAYVTGVYHGHRLKLDTFYRNEADDKTYLYTRLMLGVNVNAPEASPQTNGPEKTFTVREVVHKLTAPNTVVSKWPVKTQADGYEVYYEQRDIQTDVSYLQALLDILYNQAQAHAMLLNLGGEAVSTLQKIVEITADPNLRNTAGQLMRGIARKTEQELGYRADRLVCPQCLAHYGPHEVRFSWMDKIMFYGCRLCQQSRDYWHKEVLVVLSQQMTQEIVEKENAVYVNWLMRRTLFDFEAVVIARTSDEEVERFAVQVGNDMEETRRHRYARMRCVVSTQSGVSQNSIRILQRMFGSVEQVKIWDGAEA
jgi:hypothetical protein